MNGKAPKTIDPIRKAHIEECALHLERTANDFVEFAKDMGETLLGGRF